MKATKAYKLNKEKQPTEEKHQPFKIKNRKKYRRTFCEKEKQAGCHCFFVKQKARP